MKKKSSRTAAKKTSKSARKPIMRHSREGAKPMKKKAGKSAKSRPRLAVGRAAGRKPAAAGPGPKQRFLEALRREFPTTLKVMRALPAGAADFQPHERSATAVRLVHTFAFENMAAARITREDLQFPPNFPPAPATLDEAIEAYERGAKEVIKAVDAMPVSRLGETVTFFTGPGKMGQVPVLDVLWFLLLDSIHHRGQLSVYVRLAGGKVPSIYGPSADEPWR